MAVIWHRTIIPTRAATFSGLGPRTLDHRSTAPAIAPIAMTKSSTANHLLVSPTTRLFPPSDRDVSPHTLPGMRTRTHPSSVAPQGRESHHQGADQCVFTLR